MYPQATHNIHVHRNYAKNTDTHLYKYILHLKKEKKFYSVFFQLIQFSHSLSFFHAFSLNIQSYHILKHSFILTLPIHHFSLSLSLLHLMCNSFFPFIHSPRYFYLRFRDGRLSSTVL